MGNVDQITFKAAIDWYKQHGGEYGSHSYSDLSDKPSINGVELDGNKTTEDLHIESGTTIIGITMQVVGTNVIFNPASTTDYIKTTFVDNGNIRFIK